MTTDYPDEEQLLQIKEWDSLSDPKGLIDFIILIWRWGDEYAVLTEQENKWLLELHTGGWSGNESIIEALEENKSLFWPLYWQKSEVGGHHYFKVSKNVQVISCSKGKN